MNKTVSTIIICIVGYFAWINWLAPLLFPDWTATFYYRQGDLSRYRQAYKLTNVEECREWVRNQAYILNDTNYDYECGKNCKTSSTGGSTICEETTE